MTIKQLRLIVLFGAASLTLLSACSTVATTSADIERLPITYYSCENEVLEARFTDDRLFLSGFGFSDELYATVAASGARYESSNQRSFWSKGNEALLQTGPVLTQRCLKVEKPNSNDVIDIPFLRASGNEPFWGITIEGDKLQWSTLSGESTTFKLRERKNWAPGVFTVTDRSNKLHLLVSTSQCRDTMSGTLFPFTVQVNNNAVPYSGCAGSAVDMVFGDWNLVSVSDVASPAQASISFGDEDNVFGSDGCNRFMGGYQVNEGLSIGPLASTRMACMDEEINQFAIQYLAALQEAIAIERPDADTLVLISASGIRIVAERQ